MKFSLVLTLVAFIAPLHALSFPASQEEDAAAIVGLFADEATFARGYQHELRLDGCSARLDNGWRYYRFLLSSVDFDAWADDNHGIPLNEDAIRQIVPWMNWGGPLPRPMAGWFFDDGVPEEQQRKAKFQYERSNIDYFEELHRGGLGPWFAEHHEYKVESGVPHDFKPLAGAAVEVRPERKEAVIAALAGYTLRYCLPAPDFKCTEFFVDSPKTLCPGRMQPANSLWNREN